MAIILATATTTLSIKTSVGVLVDISVNNHFQDITISIALIEIEKCVCATGSSLRPVLSENFLDDDIADIFSMIMSVANPEMKYKLIMA